MTTAKHQIKWTLVCNNKDIITLIAIVDDMVFAADFGTKRDSIVWMTTQYQKLLSYVRIAK